MKKVLMVLLLSATRLSAQQPGSLDPTFNPADLGYGYGDGPDDRVECIALQPDGKILIAGHFFTVSGTDHHRITRLQANGDQDPNFDPGAGVNSVILAMALQSDGRIVIGGSFTSYDGVARNRIARLNTDGSLDPTFDPGSGASGTVQAIAIQPDGKILLGGEFITCNSVARSRVARLNPDGSVDMGFDPGAGASNTVNAIAVQTDGRILIGGAFTTYAGTGRNRIARLSATGNLDATFSPGTGANNIVRTMALQVDGKIVLGGNFCSYNGTVRNRLARINASGSIDLTFDPGTGLGCTQPHYIKTVLPLPDGRLFVAGLFTSFNSVPHLNNTRLTATGSVDATFDPGPGTDNYVSVAALQPDGRILIGGRFTLCNGEARNRIGRLQVNGQADAGFMVNTGANGPVHDVLRLPSGKILICGEFTAYNGVTRGRIARLEADGQLDPTFDPGSGADGVVHDIAVDGTGRIIVAGSYSLFDGTQRWCLARLHANGDLDPSFDPGSGPSHPQIVTRVTTVEVLSSGKVLIGGIFLTYDDQPAIGMARLNTNGGFDATFNVGAGLDAAIDPARAHDFIEQPGGSIVVVGNFYTYDGIVRNNIMRLFSDGTLDDSFGTEQGVSDQVHRILQLQDGRILITGHFVQYSGVPRARIARIDANGALDVSFDPGTGLSNGVESPAVEVDGKIIIAGAFTSYNGVPRSRIVRILPDGTLDASFDPGAGPDALIRCLEELPGDKILAGGDFKSFVGTGRNRLARVFAGEAPPVLLSARVMLGGPYQSATGLMADALRTLGSFPQGEPYSALGYPHVGGGGGTVTPAVLALAGNNAIVDWVVLELRDPTVPATRNVTKSALLQRDGDVVSTDGGTPVAFNVAAGNYHIAIRHRNQLGVMTAAPIALSSTTTTLDFTNPATPTYGTNAQNNVSGTMVLWPGDVNFDGTIRYVGANSDRDPILTAIGGSTPTTVVGNVYSPMDVNMDGVIRYVGANNDRDIILQTVGGSVPTATRTQQVP